jgi:hypothetical protein
MLEMRGWAARDSYNLKQAARSYQSAERFDKAYECEAKANEVDGVFATAADLYTHAGLTTRWALCLWKAGGASWIELATAGPERPRLSATPEVRLATALTRGVDAGQAGPLIASLAQAMKVDSAYRSEVLAEPHYWQKPVQDILRELLDDPAISVGGYESAEDAVTDIYELGLPIDASLRAQLAQAAGRYPKVIKLCEDYQLGELPCYANAKAHIAPFPQKISLLASTEDSSAICALYDQHDTDLLETGDAAHITHALIANGRLAHALNVCWQHGLAQQLIALAKHAVGKDNEIARRACLGWAFLAASRDVESLIRSVEGLMHSPSRFPLTDDAADDALQALMKVDLLRVRHLIARGTARNNRLAEVSEATLDSVAGLLRETFVGYEHSLDIQDTYGTPAIEVITAFERTKCFPEVKRAYEAALAQAATPEAKRPWVARGMRFYERCIQEAEKHGLSAESEDLAGRVKLALRILGIASSVDIPEYASLPTVTLHDLEEMRCSSDHNSHPVDGNAVANASNTDTVERESAANNGRPPASMMLAGKRQDNIEFTLHGVNFRVRRNLARINVEHEQSGRQGFIRLDQHLCGGDEFRWAESQHERRFVSDGCGITVEYGSAEDSPLLISLHGTGITLMIESFIVSLGDHD